MKTCNNCKKEYPLEQFVKNRQCKGGHAGVCRRCQNEYSRNWKQRNRERIAPIRRRQYAERYGKIQREKEQRHKEQYPLKVRGQVLRAGMRDRARVKSLEFDGSFFSVNYFMERLSNNPNCECCHKPLNISFKVDRKFNDNSPSIDRVNPAKGYVKGNVAILCWRCNKIKQDASPCELRVIADFMDCWGNEVEGDIEL